MIITWKSISYILFLVLLIEARAPPPTTKLTQRKINILNDSGSRVEIHWVHPTTRKTVLMTTPNIMHGATFTLDSFVEHEFEIRELPSIKTGVCKSDDKQCRTTSMIVSEGDEQVFTLNKDFVIVFSDDQVKAQEQAANLVKECKENAMKNIEMAKNSDTAKVKAAMDDLLSCVEAGVTDTLTKVNEELSFQSLIRKGIAQQLENVTCADPTLGTSDSLREETWTGSKDRKRRRAKILLDRPASKIHVIDNFISEEECQAMEAAAKPKLHRATVADGQGGSHFSENRKALQAGIKVQWDKEKSGDAIARLSRRVYDYTNHVLNLNIDEHGQEELMSIQYFGRGPNDKAPDRYTPHCDGDCDGLTFKDGTRMATMVMYCVLPESGGHTNFRNANVHVKPKKGDAVFFSYIDPKTKITDTGFTEHSGCPVFEGEKKIVTQWIRLGVNEENPWYSFNTLGVKHSDIED